MTFISFSEKVTMNILILSSLILYLRGFLAKIASILKLFCVNCGS